LTNSAESPEERKANGEDLNSGTAIQNLAAGVRSLTIQNIGNLILGFILLGVLVRLLPPNQFGIYSAVIAIYTIALAFSILGLQYAGTRFVALLNKSDPGNSWEAAKKILVLTLVFGAICTALIASISPLLSIYFSHPHTTAYSIDFVLGALYIYSATVSTVLQAIIQGLRKYNLLAKMLLVGRTAGLVLTVLGLIAFRTVEIPLLAWIAYNIIVIIWSLRIFGSNIARAKGAFEYSTILRYSIPLGLGSIVYVIANYADQIFVGGFLSTVDLAVYSAAVLISTAIGAVLFLPLNTTFLPEAARLESEAELSNGIRLAIRYSVLAILPASMIQAGVSTQLLSLFSGSTIYIRGTPSLQILSLLFVFVPLQGLVTSLLQATGETVKAMAIGLCMVASVVVLSIALIPPFQIEGAALSNALISAIGFLLGAYFTKKYLIASANYAYYLKVAVGSAASLVVTVALTVFVSDRTISLIPYAIVGLLVFLACIKGLRVITDEDRIYFSHVTPHSLKWILKYL
jgi:O-antigen/teichoic acid export membrane protein